MNDIKKQPKISVIIPVYNVEKFIRECLDSVVSQSMQDMEIICVDNGSTDSSGQILDEYAAKDSRFIVIHKPHDNIAVRNSGFEKATGEYTIFLDGDDFWSAGLCDDVYQKAKETDADMVQFLYRIHGGNPDINKPEEIEYCVYDKNPDKIQMNHVVPTVWLYLFRTEFLKKNRIYSHDGIIFADVPLAYRARFLANKIVVYPKVYYNYRFGVGYSTSAKTEEVYLTFPAAYNIMVSDVVESGADDECIKTLCLKKLKEVYFAWTVKKFIRRPFAKAISKDLRPEEIELINSADALPKKMRFFYRSITGNVFNRAYYSLRYRMLQMWDWITERMYYRSSLFEENKEKIQWLERIISNHKDYFNSEK